MFYPVCIYCSQEHSKRPAMYVAHSGKLTERRKKAPAGLGTETRKGREAAQFATSLRVLHGVSNEVHFFPLLSPPFGPALGLIRSSADHIDFFSSPRAARHCIDRFLPLRGGGGGIPPSSLSSATYPLSAMSFSIQRSEQIEVSAFLVLSCRRWWKEV